MKYLGKIQDNKDLVTKEYVDNADSGKVDKVSGKGLSTNDYTTAEKNKLAGIAAGAQVNTITGVKGDAESSYRTGNVNLTAANVGAIPTNTNGNTQNLYRPLYSRGVPDNTLDAKINTLRANRLAFLPADQIIIEKTTDGGSTWVDAGVADSTKVGLFSETRAGVSIPLLNGVKSLLCGLRITITAMKYNVPSGTAETSKYNYWNSNYIVSTERYNQLKEMYFWVSANSDTIGVKVERATGANSTNWAVAFDDSSFLMTGWSGNDYLRFGQNVFGGGTTQTTNYWNYRFTFMTKGTTASNGATLSTSYTTSAQSVMEIRAYGDTWWTAGNEYAANDKIYTHDYLKNVTFPAGVTATKINGAELRNYNNTSANANDITTNGFSYYTSNGPATSLGATVNDGALYSQAYSTSWVAQIAQDYRNGGLFVRGKNNGTWQSWQKVYDSAHKPSLSADVTGTLPVANGGTGKTTAKDAANAFMNALDTGSSTPVDADYYISQYVSGGTTTTTYHRRPMSALWSYISGKISSVLGLTASQYGGNAASATNASKVNNLTVQTAVPANAVFTDTVTTATTSGSGNAVTAISATNGALTVTKGTTFLTSHQDISGKADKSATVSTVTWDSTNKKLTKTINGTTTDVVTAATLRTGLNVADGAEVNQNAFSNVKVGSTTVAADSKTDTLELVAGSNVTLTPDATNDKVTIAATDTTYESKAAASGGTAVSLVTTGEKYTWNHKMSSIADVTTMELLTYEGITNDVMTVGLHDDDATSKVPVVNATTGKIPASVYTNTTYESKAAASGGTAVSLVTTGEKYTWNNKSSLALGETSSTAYRGDRGKTAYDHSQATHARTDATAVASSSTNGNIKINGTETTVYTHPGSGTNPHGTTKSDVGLGNVGNFKAVSTAASQGLTDTEKSNARTNIGAGTSSLTLGTSGTTAAYGNHNHTGVYSPVGHTHDGINVEIDNGGSYIPVSNIEAGDNVTLDYNNQTDTLTINATGGGGTTDYSSLSNKPKINSTTLSGNKTSADLGLQSALSVESQTLTVNSTYFSLYSGSPYTTTDATIKLRRYGKVVSITGMVKPKSAITGSDTEYTICTVPTGYRPTQCIIQVMQGSAQYRWCLKVNSGGSVTFSRYAASTSYAQASTSVWLPFHATWIID